MTQKTRSERGSDPLVLWIWSRRASPQRTSGAVLTPKIQRRGDVAAVAVAIAELQKEKPLIQMGHLPSP